MIISMILSLRELIFDNKDVFLCSLALFGHHSIKNLQNWFVVEKDLADALNQEQIAGYAADVILEEPMDKNNPLRLAKNCIITPWGIFLWKNLA